MMHVGITGGRGFLGRNLAARLAERGDCAVSILGRDDGPASCIASLLQAETIFHLAGTSRPADPREFEQGNEHFTAELCALLKNHGKSPKIVFSSSIRAGENTAYGISKLRAEEELRRYADETGATIRIYRLNNLFGKGARPNYNSVVASFCHNMARGLPIDIRRPEAVVPLSFVEDVVESFLDELSPMQAERPLERGIHVYPVRVDDLANKISELHQTAGTKMLPDFSHPFTRALYATYLSYVPMQELLRPITAHANSTGMLFELFKEQHFGQILVLRMPPGATRGNHSHHAKTERFIVLEGDGLIKIRPADGTILSFRVRGDRPQTVDIPPGATHSISNVGAGALVTLVWSSSVFDPARPDTVPCPVEPEEAMKDDCRSPV